MGLSFAFHQRDEFTVAKKTAKEIDVGQESRIWNGSPICLQKLLIRYTFSLTVIVHRGEPS
jgi:hypothetical protein